MFSWVKKDGGLWVQQWTDGIVDWSFTEDEIMNEFVIRGIEIPETFKIDFSKVLAKKKMIRNEKYLKELIAERNEGKKSLMYSLASKISSIFT
jgi:lysozyme family protein